MENRMAHYISGAENADEHHARPKNEPKESPGKLLLIIDRLRREYFGIRTFRDWLCIV